MENAADALKMAFAVMVFVMALSISIFMFTKARETSEMVLHSSDITEYMEYEEVNANNKTRLVGLETIVPTLYKYYKENYTVIFLDSNGNGLKLYETQTDPLLWSGNTEKTTATIPPIVSKYPGITNHKTICSFDVDEETKRHEPWTGNADYYKSNLDTFLQGGKFFYPDGTGRYYEYKGFMNEYKKYKFKEDLGEYTYNEKTSESSSTSDNTSTIKEKKKRVIIYTLQK